VFPGGRFAPRFLGRDAVTIAAAAGIEVPRSTRVLLAPLEFAMPEEPLAHPKPCPVAGVLRVPDVARGIRAAVAVLRIGFADGPGGSGRARRPRAEAGSAVIHSADPGTVLEYTAAVRVSRVAVNAGGSMIGPVLEPKHLVSWTTAGYGPELAGTAEDFVRLSPWHPPSGPVPPYPDASNVGQP
jgi:acetaldehyde dehydrogenase/alcohol dehydrogenase